MRLRGLSLTPRSLIADLLERRKMKKADLARLLNKTPAFVSQLLNGKANMTVRTLAEVVYVLGGSVKMSAEDEDEANAKSDDSAGAHTFHMPLNRKLGSHPSIAFHMPEWNAKRLTGTNSGEPSRLSENVA